MEDKFMIKGTMVYAYDAKQGQFCVTGDTFRELCMSHDVKVNWANK